jgi:hypothetical protein
MYHFYLPSQKQSVHMASYQSTNPTNQQTNHMWLVYLNGITFNEIIKTLAATYKNNINMSDYYNYNNYYKKQI